MSEALKSLISTATGPAPWFWQTFPAVHGGLPGMEYEWRHHGETGELAYLVTLHAEGQLNIPRLALNTYCRPFTIDEASFGIWCPEGRSLRFVAMQQDSLVGFDFKEIVGWFKNSSERIYSATAPRAEFEIPLALPPGTHPIQVPEDFRVVDEILVPTSYKAMSKTDPAFAIFVVYPQAQLVEVLPQNWITQATHDIGNNWITRAARDPQSHAILGEMAKVGPFELQPNGRDFLRWL